MRLKQHINEMNDIFGDREHLGEEELNDLKKGCKPFLKDMKRIINNEFHMLYRGFQRREGDFSYKKPRKDRRPTDSSKLWHDALDHVFYKKWKVKPRSEGVFCKIVTPTGYGMDYMIFPINKYFCIWSERVSDAYFWEPNIIVDGDTYEDLIPDAEAVLPSYQKGSLVDVTKSLHVHKNYEVALMCKSYYMVDIKFWGQITEWVKNEI